MALAKKPTLVKNPKKETKARKFIAAAASHSNGQASDVQPVVIRFERDLLNRIDAAAQDDHRSRTSFIVIVLKKAMEKLEAGE
jgi:hypothetical protein